MSFLKNLYKRLYALVISGKQKAVGAFLVGTIGSYLVSHGLTLQHLNGKTSLQALLVGVASHLVVYFKKNR